VSSRGARDRGRRGPGQGRLAFRALSGRRREFVSSPRYLGSSLCSPGLACAQASEHGCRRRPTPSSCSGCVASTANRSSSRAAYPRSVPRLPRRTARHSGPSTASASTTTSGGAGHRPRTPRSWLCGCTSVRSSSNGAVRGVSRVSEGSVRDKAQLAKPAARPRSRVARARGRIDSLYRAQAITSPR